MMKRLLLNIAYLFISIQLFSNLVLGKPSVSNDGQNANGVANVISKSTEYENTEAIYERLKSGDAETWRQYGSEVVNVVYELVDEGEADDPFDALLMLFYPNLNSEERKVALRNFEPILREMAVLALTDDALRPESEQLPFYKRKRQETSATDPAEIAVYAKANAEEQLRDALRQLKIQPSESLVNLDTIARKKQPPQRRAGSNGQKESPIYLGTHESPKGVSWRV